MEYGQFGEYGKCGRVVIIEDDKEIRDALAVVLQLEGYPTQAFSNGKEALLGLSGQKENCLILLDLMMPVMDGWEFLKARKDFDHAVMALPVVIVSAAGPLGESAMDQVNVRGYVRKPIDMELLLQLVRKHCGAPAQKMKYA